MFFRDTEIQWSDNNRIFTTPGIVYRPSNLKSITVLEGNNENRKIYKKFSLDNLHLTRLDNTHQYYEKYLQYNFFIPPADKKYFAHTMYNTLPADANQRTPLGLFNIFPLGLNDDAIKTPSTSIGKYIEKKYFF